MSEAAPETVPEPTPFPLVEDIDSPGLPATETKRYRLRVGDRVEWSQHAGHSGGYGHVKAIANPEATTVLVEFDIDGRDATAGGLKGTTGGTLELSEDEVISSQEPAANAPTDVMEPSAVA